MGVVYDRIYIRFKGRVLGPLPHEKVAELVARGQITRDQEMSCDAVNWSKASEFSAFFPAPERQLVQSIAVTESVGVATKVTWFLNIEGEDSSKSYDEATILRMIAVGKVQKTTLLWDQESGAWLEAGAFRPQWFAHTDRDATRSNQSTNGEISSQSIAQSLIAARPWLSFLSIAGLITAVIIALTSLSLFFAVIVWNYANSVRIVLVVALASQFIASLGWLFVGAKLMTYVGRLTAIEYRGEASEVQAVLASQSGLAVTVSIVFAFWALVTISGLLVVVATWQVAPSFTDPEYSHLYSQHDLSRGRG